MGILKTVSTGLVGVLAVSGVAVAALSWQTERDIGRLEQRIALLAEAHPPGYVPEIIDGATVASLPVPVQRYFRYVFRGPVRPVSHVELVASGDFRRPLTEGFNPTTARQVIAIGAPALMFSVRTSMPAGAWARAYDFYADGEMEMKAKVLSALTVVDESASAELNRISLRRWLLESALYPQALLPGGPVTWEAIDTHRARAVVHLDNLSASIVAEFDDEGRMTQMMAEQDGDLTTPYHGSGEHVTRGNYQRVGDVMVPMAFTISRAAAGEIHPFWDGRVTGIEFR